MRAWLTMAGEKSSADGLNIPPIDPCTIENVAVTEHTASAVSVSALAEYCAHPFPPSERSAPLNAGASPPIAGHTGGASGGGGGVASAIRVVASPSTRSHAHVITSNTTARTHSFYNESHTTSPLRARTCTSTFCPSLYLRHTESATSHESAPLKSRNSFSVRAPCFFAPSSSGASSGAVVLGHAGHIPVPSPFPPSLFVHDRTV